MNSRYPLVSWFPLSGVVAGLCFGLISGPLEAEVLDFEFQAGQSELETKKFQEIDKTGYALGLMGLKYFDLPRAKLGLGLGALSSKVEGKKASRGITQDLSVTLLSIDLRYLYEFLPAFSVGPVLRGSFGRGAKYSVQQNDDVDLLVSPGVMFRYQFREMPYKPSLHFHYMHDANVAKRNIQSYLVGVSVTTNVGGSVLPRSENVSASPAPAASPSSEVATVSPEAVSGSQSAPPAESPKVLEIEGVPPVTAETPPEPGEGKPPEMMVFRFAPNSTRLNGISRERAKALAKVLSENPDSWSKILVTGHSDKSGDAGVNLALSQRRTDAFCDLMAKRGVSRKKMECVAMGFQELLPGLADNAEEHRRVEVRFEEVASERADELRKLLERSLQL